MVKQRTAYHYIIRFKRLKNANWRAFFGFFKKFLYLCTGIETKKNLL